MTKRSISQFAQLIVILLWLLSWPCSAQWLMETVKAPKSEAKVRLRTDVVNLTVSVTDAQNVAIAGLTQQHFEIYENNVKQTISYFKDTDEPISIGIILDFSGSMGKKIHHARTVVKSLVDSSHQDDEYFLLGFNQQPYLISDFTDANSILASLKETPPKGPTALHDAVVAGLEKLQVGRYARRALIIISDGEDNRSLYTKRELIQRLKEENILVYCLGYNMWWRADGDNWGQFLLEDLASITGGSAFFPRSQAKLEAAVSTIALQLRRQYSIGYVSSDERRNGEWRKIHLLITSPSRQPKLKLRTRLGYVAEATGKGRK